MAHLTLVRHGQATPFEKITDRLSPLGEAQSRKLAEYWIRNQVAFDQVYTGSLERQRLTAELAGEVFRAAGLAWPETRIVPELNEYDADGIIKHFAPRLLEESANGNNPDRNRRFQRTFEALMNRWVLQELEAPGVESWRAFRERVELGLRGIMHGGTSGRRVVAFTSGGPIGVAVQIALDAPGRSALQVNWRVRNCSVTEFLFSGARLSLDTFNAIPHLDDPALRTFR